MSEKSKEEVMKMMRHRYAGRGREGRSRLLDEFCELCGYERKYAIKLLGGRRRPTGKLLKRGGSEAKYGEAEGKVLKIIWLAAEQPCKSRLKAAMEIWLPHYEREHGLLEHENREKLLKMSATTMERLLSSYKARVGSRGRCGTRPGTLLRTQIPVRTEHWDVSGPGWMEADTVAHCGGSMDGDFCWSLTMTDVHTQWTETRAVWNKGQHGVAKRIAEVEEVLPFEILGFDSDNGGEFLNYHLLDYFRVRARPVAFTRSRPYRKNDNARVEQKNWTHVRQLVGYGRLGEPWQAEALNELYAKEWSQFRNFFCPAIKHLRTETEGSRKRRIYDNPRTPFQRLKACSGGDAVRLEALEALYTSLNPFKLKRMIETRLRKILRPSTRVAA